MEVEGELDGFELGSLEGAELVEGAALGVLVGWDVPNSGPKPPPSDGRGSSGRAPGP